MRRGMARVSKLVHLIGSEPCEKWTCEKDPVAQRIAPKDLYKSLPDCEKRRPELLRLFPEKKTKELNVLSSLDSCEYKNRHFWSKYCL